MNRHHRTTETLHQAGTDRGATLVEYVLLLSLIVLVCLASLTAFGDTVGGNIDSSASRVVAAGGVG